MTTRTPAQDLEESAERAKSLAEGQDLSLRASQLHRMQSAAQSSLLPFPLFRN
ncbi:hypothetical protein [Sphingomonas xinjiangensis]|uniref:Uncharacterized protein n=1 Tax=Sphingomonas xinjiangensis TaxID=643568 RepID=A0A840YP98_9SPHN|nr:hypothetical protein [Sphingomonas xinjiangensis]MBB5709193.1 hypothetical protein [Sphingomonas xinjiangensis]